MKDNKLFRPEALQQLNSPEQLDQLIQIVTPRAWLAAGTLYAILFCLLVWSFFGSIPTRAEGYGILLAGGGGIHSIASQGSGLDTLVYLPSPLGKRVKVGMHAQVVPASVEKTEFGSIDGKVISVSPFPTIPEALQIILQNPELAKKFAEQEPPIEVRIQLKNDPKTFSGLKWSSSQGPKQTIMPGTLATTIITIHEQPPITLFIPALKHLMGIE